MISKHLPHLKCLWSELLFLHLLQGLHIWNLRITWYPHVLMWTSWQLDYLLDLDFLKGWVYDLLLCIAPNPITVPSRHQTLKCRFVKVTNLYFKKYLSALKRERRRNYFWSSHTNRCLSGFISGRVYFLLTFKFSYSRLLSHTVSATDNIIQWFFSH